MNLCSFGGGWGEEEWGLWRHSEAPHPTPAAFPCARLTMYFFNEDISLKFCPCGRRGLGEGFLSHSAAIRAPNPTEVLGAQLFPPPRVSQGPAPRSCRLPPALQASPRPSPPGVRHSHAPGPTLRLCECSLTLHPDHSLHAGCGFLRQRNSKDTQTMFPFQGEKKNNNKPTKHPALKV